MKEITFNELIEESPLNELLSVPEIDLVKELLQQVREATIAEVLTLCDDNFFSKEPKGKLMENIENLPTDRIKIKE